MFGSLAVKQAHGIPHVFVENPAFEDSFGGPCGDLKLPDDMNKLANMFGPHGQLHVVDGRVIAEFYDCEFHYPKNR